MRKLVSYQELKTQSKAEGIKEGEVSLVLRQLKCCIGTISAEDESRITGLSVEQLEALGEALLDFSSGDDLRNWLAAQKLLLYLSLLLSRRAKIANLVTAKVTSISIPAIPNSNSKNLQSVTKKQKQKNQKVWVKSQPGIVSAQS